MGYKRGIIYFTMFALLAIAVRIRANILNHRTEKSIVSMDEEVKRWGIPVDVAKVSRGKLEVYQKVSGTLDRHGRIQSFVQGSIFSKLKIGQKFIFTYSDTIHHGRVEEIFTDVDFVTGLYRVVLKPNVNLKISKGKIINSLITISNHRNVLKIPDRAVFVEKGKSFCWIIKNALAVKAEIHTGKNNGNEVQVNSGLSLEDIVVINGKSTLKNGSSVRIRRTPGEYYL